MKEGESSPRGYILRIARDEWVKQVFDRKKYYVGVRGRWEPGRRNLGETIGGNSEGKKAVQ